MGHQLDQALHLKSPDPFPHERVGSGDETTVFQTYSHPLHRGLGLASLVNQTPILQRCGIGCLCVDVEELESGGEIAHGSWRQLCLLASPVTRTSIEVVRKYRVATLAD